MRRTAEMSRRSRRLDLMRRISALRIGCAGWSIASAHAADFPREGSHLERYAQVFDAVEIDSSFYRPHQRKTYARWAVSTPRDFRFAVKMPKIISHQNACVAAPRNWIRSWSRSAGSATSWASCCCNCPRALLSNQKSFRRSLTCYAATARPRSPASRAMPRGSTPKRTSCCAISVWLVPAPIRRAHRERRLPRAVIVSSTCGCMARRACTGMLIPARRCSVSLRD